MSQTLSCPNCGASIDFKPGDDPVVRCQYCRSSVVLPDEVRGHPATAPREAVDWPEEFFQPERIGKIQEIARLVQQGEKIKAIMAYEDLFGVGLKQAGDAIERLIQGKALSISDSYQPGADQRPLETEIWGWLQSGKRIEAIKAYRLATGEGLMEAKLAVEAFERGGALPLPAQLHEESRLATHMVAIVELVQAGEKESAIEAYRRAFAAGFGEAQEAIHKIARAVTANPSLPATQSQPLPAHNSTGTSARPSRGFSGFGFLRPLLVILLMVVPVLIVLASHGGPLESLWKRVDPLAFARLSLSFGEEGRGAGWLDDPRWIALDPQDNLYVVNYSDGRVQKFDSTGSYQMLWNIGEGKYVSTIAVDRAGDVYLLFGGEIWKYDGESGQALGRQADEAGTRFEAISETPDGGILAAYSSERIVRFTQTGEQVILITSPSGAPQRVEDLAVDGAGNLYLLTKNESVLVYSPEGHQLLRFGGLGDEPGQFRMPESIAVDGLGRIYISDFKGIQVFSNDGRYLDRIDVGGFPFGLAFDSQGDLWVVSNLPKMYKFKISQP